LLDPNILDVTVLEDGELDEHHRLSSDGYALPMLIDSRQHLLYVVGILEILIKGRSSTAPSQSETGHADPFELR
jgi:hypothetical protein